MKKYLFITALVISCLLLLVSGSQAAVVVGEPAPAFTAQDTDGAEHSLSAYKGKYVVLEWFNYDCPFVKKHYGSGNMQALQKKYTDKDIIWLSICSSALGKQGHYPAEEINLMATEREAGPTAVILDPEGTIGRSFGAATTPHIFIIDPEGRVIYQGAIDSVSGTDQGEIAEALNYVALTLDTALNGKPVEVPSTKSYGCSVKY